MSGFIRARSAVNFNLADLVGTMMDSQRAIVAQVAKEAGDRLKPSLLNELAQVPGPAKHPFQFATLKSQRKYFAMIKDGEIDTANGRYVRKGSGGYGDTWRVEYNANNDTFNILIYSTWRKAKYIGGSLARDANAAARFQVPGHRNTGWQRNSPIVWSYIDDMVDLFRELYFDATGDAWATAIGKQRAYTAPR
jgi:hypothetical protein